METFLRRWWVKKYRLPWTHELAQNQTLPDLLVEFYEDAFEKNPSEARKTLSKDGVFFFESTGDALLDKWEKEIAQGLVPDLEEGLSSSEREKLKKERNVTDNSTNFTSGLMNIDDNYTINKTYGNNGKTNLTNSVLGE